MRFSLRKLFSTSLDWIKDSTSIFQMTNRWNIKTNCGLKIHLLSIHSAMSEKEYETFIEITSDSSLQEKFKLRWH